VNSDGQVYFDNTEAFPVADIERLVAAQQEAKHNRLAALVAEADVKRASAHDSRVKWDDRFLEIAAQVSTWSKDPSTKCGAVIVRPDRTIVSTGYNGFPKGCDDSEEFYADRELKLARVVHAELNAILHAREPLQGYTMYTYPPGWGPSCDRCTAHIIQAGITRVVHRRDESEFARRWKESAERGLQMFEEAGVEVIHA
jgi:dCMP deaminase